MNKNYWIITPTKDILFFISPPLYIIPIILFVKTRISIETLGLIIMGIGGLGHHLPGLIRAYSDPVLFKRFKSRFILSPIFLLSVCLFFSWNDLSGLNLVLVGWGSWHAAMQVNGFLRIYDAKGGSSSRVTAWLDWSLCLFWFGAVILLSPAKLTSLLGHFYNSGGIYFSYDFLNVFRILWISLTAILTIGYIFHAIRSINKNTAPSPLKILSLLVSLSFWWFCMVTVDNLVFGILMWELFHDIQYNALVWVYNLQRVKKGITSSLLEKFLFRPDGKKVFIYLLLVTGYGFFGILTNYIDIHSPVEMTAKNPISAILTKMTLLSAFLHFYFDGFIWKVRDKNFRLGMGLNDRTETSTDSKSESTRISHGLKWLLFIIPVAYLGIIEMKKRPEPDTHYSNLAESVPNSWKANILAGSTFLNENKPDSAMKYLNRAVKLKPEVGLSYKLMSELYIQKGDTIKSNSFLRKYYYLEKRNN